MILTAGKNVKLQKLSFIAVRDANGTTILEDSLVVSYKTAYSLTISPASAIFGINPTTLKSISTQKLT